MGPDLNPVYFQPHRPCDCAGDDPDDHESHLHPEQDPDSVHRGDLFRRCLCFHQLHVGCAGHDRGRYLRIFIPEIWIFRIPDAAGIHSCGYV